MHKPSTVVWPAFLVTRLLVLFVAYQAVMQIGYPERPVFRISEDPVWNLQARWDAGWYLALAKDGYSWRADRVGRQQNIAFFPAFPMLMRGAGTTLDLAARWMGLPELLGGRDSRFVIGGSLVALMAFWWALHYLFRFTRAVAGDEEKAANAVWLLAAYPFALFYSAPYTEALFLLTTVAAFYHLERGEYRWAGLWGLMAGLTRPNGFLLAAPLGLLAIAPRGWTWLNRRPAPERSVEGTSSRIAKGLAASATPVLGMLLYSAFLGYRFGRPFAWTEAQAGWGRSFQGTNYFVWRWTLIADEGWYAYVTRHPVDVLNVAALLLCAGLLWTVTRRLGVAYLVFVVANLLPPILIDLPAFGRMTSVMFPVFVALALALRSSWALPIAGAFTIVQVLAASLFYTWRQLY